MILMSAALILTKAPVALAEEPMAVTTPTPQPQNGSEDGEGPETESDESTDANTIVDELLASRPCEMFPQKPVQYPTYDITGSGWINCGRATLFDGSFHVCLMWEGLVLETTCGVYPMSGKSFEDGYGSSGCLPGEWRTHTTLHYLGETYLNISSALDVDNCPLPRV
jgi:hypothetical protein